MTPKQRDTLDCIQRHIRENRTAPTQAELANRLGVSQPSVYRRLMALEKHGAIERASGMARGIRLVALNHKDTVVVKRSRLEFQMEQLLEKMCEIGSRLADIEAANDT